MKAKLEVATILHAACTLVPAVRLLQPDSLRQAASARRATAVLGGWRARARARFGATAAREGGGAWTAEWQTDWQSMTDTVRGCCHCYEVATVVDGPTWASEGLMARGSRLRRFVSTSSTSNPTSTNECSGAGKVSKQRQSEMTLMHAVSEEAAVGRTRAAPTGKCSSAAANGKFATAMICASAG